MSGSPRRDDIDTLRAFACVALVSYHVVGASPAAGLEVPRTHMLVLCNAVLSDLRMPLFSFLSGLVFAASTPGQRPLAWWGYQARSKARRLLLPLVTVGALFWLARATMGYDQMPLWQVPFMPYAHFWFLQATFLLMMIMLALVWITGGQVWLAATLMGGIAAGLWLSGWRPAWDIFAVDGALRLAPFFALGVGVCTLDLRRWRDHVPQFSRSLGLALVLGALMLGGFTVFGPGAVTGYGDMLIGGVAGCLGLMLIAPRHPLCARLGQASYVIYLFHVFFAAGVTEVLRHTLPDLSPALVWLMALTAGLAGPFLLERLLVSWRWTAWACLGLRLQPPTTAPVAANHAMPSHRTVV